MISKEILLEYGAVIKKYKKGDLIFKQGDDANYYYQIISGVIKINNYNDKGKEFVLHVFDENITGFGEPPMVINKPYPANAEVEKDAEVLVLPKAKFINLITNTDVGLKLIEIFSERLYYKSIIAIGISSQTPEERIISLLKYIKDNSESLDKSKLFKFNITRQEIANLLGLRVETVIRAIKDLENKNIIEIIDRKIYSKKI